MTSVRQVVISAFAEDLINAVAREQADLAAARTAAVEQRLQRVLEALAAERVGTQHFASLTGYGHGDQGREVVDRVFARVLGAEAAAVRLQFVSGTHAIAAALFGVLRPGDRLLSITGRPYDTLEEVIGLRGKGQGSLAEFGVAYDEIDLQPDGAVDQAALNQALEQPCRMVLIQRSCGYSWRPSIDVEEIGRLSDLIHSHQSDCVVFVDNCYGELVQDEEPPAGGGRGPRPPAGEGPRVKPAGPAPQLGEEAAALLEPGVSVPRRTTRGGGSPAAVADQIKRFRARLDT